MYNSNNQVGTVTNALGVVTTRNYFPVSGAANSGRLASIVRNSTAALDAPSETVSFSYDLQGRVATVTRPGEETTSFAYDAVDANPSKTLDRVQEVTYPDDSTEEVEFEHFLVKRKKDRLDRWTTFTHDLLGRIDTVTDPANRTITFNRANCCDGGTGAVEELIDAKGNVTKWNRDAAGRLTSKQISGTTVSTYEYSSRTGELAAEGDANGNRKEYSYFADGQLQSVHYAILGTVSRPRRT